MLEISNKITFKYNEVLKNSTLFSGVKYIGKLIELTEGKQLNGEALNYETIKTVEHFLELVNNTIGNIDDVKYEKVYKIATELSEKLNDKGDNIGLIVQNILLSVKNISLEREIKKLQEHSYTDVLTGLINRRSMELYIEDAIKDKQTNGENYGVIIIDIDFFKIINDNYGHDTGDIALKEISIIFQYGFREIDKVCRWGGEEFLILMKGGNKNAYIKKMNEIKTKVENTLVDLINKKLKEDFCQCENKCKCEIKIKSDKKNNYKYLNS